METCHIGRRAAIRCGTAALWALATAWPVAGQGTLPRALRIGVLSVSTPPGNSEAFRVALAEYGYVEGKKLAFERRQAGGRSELVPGLAGELVQNKVDFILTCTTAATRAARQATSTIPIIAFGPDLLALGLVRSLARPGALWFAASSTNTRLRERIVQLAARERLPAVYSDRVMVEAGGLMSCAILHADQQRRTAVYIDKVLRGTPVGDLPVELPTRFELVINLKTATALGLTMPQDLLLQADDVIRD